MFALVANGGVSSVSETTRATTGGTWLQLVEDPTTYDPAQPQQPAGFTVHEDHVVRHWRATPRPLTTDDLDAIHAKTDALAEAIDAVTPTEQRAQVTATLEAAGLTRQEPEPPTKGRK